MKRTVLVTAKRDDLELLGRELEAARGCRVSRVDGPEAALAQLGQARFDIVLLPSINGPGWERVLGLAFRGSLPIVYSDQDDPEMAVSAIRLGARRYLDSRKHSPEEAAERVIRLAEGEEAEELALARQDRIRELEAKGRQFSLLFDHMLSAFAYHRIVLDERGVPVDYIFLQVNPAFEQMTGLSREKVLGKSICKTQPGFKENDAEWIRIYGDVALTGKPVHFERYSENLGRWLEVSAYSPERYHFATVFDDVTERKEREEELRSALLRKTTLLREIHHRVKNNMQVVSSLLSLQLGHGQGSTARALERSQERIHSMAVIHELLYRSAELDRVELLEYVGQLARDMIQGLQPPPNLTVEGERLELSGEEAFSVGLAVTEALSNSLIHGAGDEVPRIRISVSRSEDSASVTVRDWGPGFIPSRDVTSRALGFTLMREMAEQLGGRVVVENDGGAKVTIRFPLKQER